MKQNENILAETKTKIQDALSRQKHVHESLQNSQIIKSPIKPNCNSTTPATEHLYNIENDDDDARISFLSMSGTSVADSSFTTSIKQEQNKIKDKKEQIFELDKTITEKLSLLSNLEDSITQKQSGGNNKRKVYTSRSVNKLNSNNNIIELNKRSGINLKTNLEISVHSLMAKMEDFDTYNNIQIHILENV
eukprot:UN23531